MDYTNKKNKIVTLIILVILLIGALYFLWHSKLNKSYQNRQYPAQDTSGATTGVKVTANDTTVAEGRKTPTGFPSIPIDGVITESYRAVYTIQNLTQYTVSFTSPKTKDELWNEYNDYIIKSGYEIDKNLTNKNNFTLSSTKDGDSLNIVISTQNKMSLVQINFLDRP